MLKIIATPLIILATGVSLMVTPAQAEDPTHPQRYAACQYEDGPGPCIWDGKHMGDGRGKSVYMKRNGDTVRIPHHIAHYLTH